MTLRLVVTGLNGQLATALDRRARGTGSVEAILIGRPAMDVRDERSVMEAVRAASPDVVVNAAAYTAVDKAEDESDAAAAVNETGARNVARAAAALNVPVFQLSTDYVYRGDKPTPYIEADRPDPLSVYGVTKLAGERAVAEECDRYLILRTAWVHSGTGSNFVRTMLRLAGDRDVVRVVSDQLGCPTRADHLADAVLELAMLCRAMDRSESGVLHVAGSGETNWAGFAEAIFAESRKRGGPSARVDPIPSSAYPTRAVRPANSRLDTTRLAGLVGRRLPHWRDGAAESVADLLSGTWT